MAPQSTRIKKPVLFAIMTVAVAMVVQPFLKAAETAMVIAPAKYDLARTAGTPQIAVVAGGCFWGMQGVFEHVRGVRKVVAGYAGGDRNNAEYERVSMGDTGHAESVQITYDPAVVSYGELLRVFFSVAHNPTELNRQGPDTGTQYRSAIFYTSEDQKRVAQAYITQLNQSHAFGRDIVTAVSAFNGFYPAEIYHQDYLIRHPHEPYIVFNDVPKIINLQRVLPDYYQGTPVSWH